MRKYDGMEYAYLPRAPALIPKRPPWNNRNDVMGDDKAPEKVTFLPGRTHSPIQLGGYP